jgi:uncharacterized protein (UPF0210 family)
MKIRSITYFDNLKWPLDSDKLRQASRFINAAKEIYQTREYEVSTTRLATPPFPLVLRDRSKGDVLRYAIALEERLIGEGFDYISIGPAIPNYPESYMIIPEILTKTENVFGAGIISSGVDGIALSAVKACAEVIHRNAGISSDGFANLRFAALANVPPGTPFLPAAYHHVNGQPAFALATEAADLAVTAFRNSSSLKHAIQSLIEALESHAGALTILAESLAEGFDLHFGGIDFTLAPFPLAELSIGTAIESMGVPAVGEHGSLAAVSILAEALDRAQFQRTGFTGIILPILEDFVLAKRAHEGRLTLNDMMLYSAVCGTGLDTIPLPGDVTEEQLQAILLDLAALSQRLDKPLTARLMPIPGKRAGDLTEFDFEYFAPSRVMDLKASALSGLLAGDETIELQSRNAIRWESSDPE